MSSLRRFLSTTPTREEAERVLKEQLSQREAAFLRVLELGIYGNHRSPYRRLLQHAGYSFDDVKALVEKLGLDDALSHLYDAGIYVSLDEFKGRMPVRREGLEFEINARDFDNPLSTAHFEGNTGGTRGSSRIQLDLGIIGYEAYIHLCNLYAHDAVGRPVVFWRAAPPSAHGIRGVLGYAKMGLGPEKWYSPTRTLWNRQGLQGRALVLYTTIASRLCGRPVPRPVHLPLRDVSKMVDHLARLVRRGTPAYVLCVPSLAVRICLAAEEAGASIAGTVFLAGAEPYTDGKKAIIERAGARGIPNYAMNEAGMLGIACGNPASTDEYHVLTDKLAVLERVPELASGPAVKGLFYTSLLASSSKIMLNVESGDYGTISERECGCLWQQLGFRTHLAGVRSYEKLTSEGVMFMGTMLYDLLEHTLPARFGGSVADYQFVEEEEDGLTRVSILVSPRLGVIDEAAVLETIFEGVGVADWSRRMADEWRQAGTLRVQRREPYATAAFKIMPLHVIESREQVAPGQGSGGH
jgi:hypothetical protein